MIEETETQQESTKEKKRSRKKLLYSNLRNLMEFYFSAANLCKDRWLSQQLDETGSIELARFLSFNKVRALTNDVNHLIKALRSSEILEVSDDCRVRRTKEVEVKENPDDCIIYVEQIPSDADHDWVKNFFSCYGPIDYISLPKYANTKKCKGFAFIEFKDPETAKKAIDAYKEAGRYLSNTIEPQELLSIATFEDNSKQLPNTSVEIESSHRTIQPEMDTSNSKKRKGPETKLEDDEDNIVESAKKQKLDENEKSNELSDVDNVAANSQEDLPSEECSGEIEGNGDESKRKKTRKKKKKNKKNKITPEKTGFQILSKKDWKSLRNKYLNIQKEKMKQLKKNLKHMKSSEHYKKSKPVEKSKSNEVCINENNQETSPPVKDFAPGVIVKINFTEPLVNLKEFKNELKTKHQNVKYIDVKEGTFNAYIRMSTAEDAVAMCEKTDLENVEVLKDEEELEYWQKVEESRRIKFSKPSQKKRGKERLLKKADKVLGKHVVFDES